jgi:hypothetical protein
VRPPGCLWSSCRRPRCWPPPSPVGSNTQQRRAGLSYRRTPALGWRWIQRGKSTLRCMVRCMWGWTGDSHIRSCQPRMQTARRRYRSSRWGTVRRRCGWKSWAQRYTHPVLPPAATRYQAGSTRPHHRKAPGTGTWSWQGSSTLPRTAHCRLATLARALHHTRLQGTGTRRRQSRTARPGKASEPPGSMRPRQPRRRAR